MYEGGAVIGQKHRQAKEIHGVAGAYNGNPAGGEHGTGQKQRNDDVGMEALCRRICDKNRQEIEHDVGDEAEHLVGGVVGRDMAKAEDDQNNFKKTSGRKGRYNGLHDACNEFKEGTKQAD